VPSLDSVLKEVAKRRRGSESLRDQLLWRAEALAPHGNFSDAKIREAFREVIEAFQPPGFELRLDPDLCVMDPKVGSIVIGGNLWADGLDLGLIQRRLMLRDQYAIHEVFILKEFARGRGVSSVSLKRCFTFYDGLGFSDVILEADMTGKWHWARVGFDFVLDKDRENVRNWTIRSLNALKIEGLRVEGYTSAAQFARMGGTRKLSLGGVARALPAAERGRVARIASENGLALDEEIELARALMLCGPRWFGRLELQGPGRVAFDTYARAKIQGLGS
jgi:hypothetical protein